MIKLAGNLLNNIGYLKYKKKISFDLLLQILALFLVFFTLAPIFNIIFVSLGDNKNLLFHLMETVLPRYFINTIFLMAGVGLLAAIFGISSGWIIARYDFWGRKTLSWMLVLPAAIPAYLIAFTYTDFLEYAGPVQTYLRLLFGWNGPRDYWFPDVRTHFGAILMMACVLYPYIYIFVRTAFQRISRTLFEAAALTGKPLFSSVAIPLARPAIIASLSLVLMEVVSDFGTVDYFGIETLTLGIFNVWLGMNNIVAAAQISLIAFILILLLLALERYARSNRLFSNKSPGVKGMPRIEIEPKLQLICFLICGLPVLIGFILPVMILISFVIKSDEVNAIQYLYETFYNTILISLVSALIIIFISSFLSIVSFYRLNKSTQFFAGLSATGYAFPGTILAIGILHFLAQIESTAQLFISGFIPYSNEVIVSGTIFVLIIAYLTRFNAVGFGSVTAGLEQIPQDLISASQILGKRFGSSVGAVLLPNLWPAILAGGLLLFVDIMKELPLTLLLRPMDFETFATITYQLAKSEMLEQAAYPALCIVVSGLIPVVIANIALSKIAEK